MFVPQINNNNVLLNNVVCQNMSLEWLVTTFLHLFFTIVLLKSFGRNILLLESYFVILSFFIFSLFAYCVGSLGGYKFWDTNAAVSWLMWHIYHERKFYLVKTLKLVCDEALVVNVNLGLLLSSSFSFWRRGLHFLSFFLFLFLFLFIHFFVSISGIC